MAHIVQYLSAAAQRWGERRLTECEGRCRSARELQDRVAALAAALRLQGLLEVGEAVALAGLASDHFLEGLLAVSAAGGLPAPLNWRWSAAEAGAAVQLCGARLLLADAACLALALQLAERCEGLAHVVVLGPAPASLPAGWLRGEELAVHAWGAPLALATAPEGGALLCFTSGTTGAPKAALLSHTALHCQALAKVVMVGYSAGDVYLHAAPLFHIGGLASAVAMLMVGAQHVFLPRFSAPAAVAAIQAQRVTALIAVPAMLADLLAAGPGQGLPGVRRLLVGAGALAPQLLAGCRRLFPRADITTAYGMTEACSSITFASAHELPSRQQAGRGWPVGQPPPGVEVAVRPLPEGGQQGGEGEGEVVTRGPHVMLRYWGDPGATAAALLPDGWLRTGDCGRLTAAGLELVSRLKDIIRSGGESVVAGEVEAALARHPGVAAAAVVGLPHPRLGQQVAALLRLRPAFRWSGPASAAVQQPVSGVQQECTADTDGRVLTLEKVQAHCRSGGLSAYKVPRLVAARHELLPTTASGKVHKQRVTQELTVLADQAAKARL